MNDSVSQIVQNHAGSGDNVRDKIINIFPELVPSELQSSFKAILSDIRAGRLDVARIRIETLKSTARMSPVTHTVLDLLSVHGELVSDQVSSKTKGDISELYKSSVDGTLRDVCLSALLRIYGKSRQSEIARKLYENESCVGPYAKEVYLSSFASLEEVNEAWAHTQILPAESELNGIFHGYRRLGEHDLAQGVSNVLSTEFPSIPNRINLFLANAQLLSMEIGSTQSWSITYELKVKIDDLATEAASLINITSGQEKKLFDVAVPVLGYIGWSHLELYESCVKYLHCFEAEFPEVAANLMLKLKGDDSRLTVLEKSINKARRSDVERGIFISGLLEKSTLDLLEALVFIDLANVEEMRIWKERSYPVDISGKEFEGDYLIIRSELFLLSEDSYRGAEHQARIILDGFIDKHGSMISELRQAHLLSIAKLAIKMDLPSVVVRLLESVVPSSNAWLSPLTDIYLFSLAASEQLSTFDQMVATVPDIGSSDSCWLYRAKRHTLTGDNELALLAAEKALEIDELNIKGWEIACSICRDAGRHDDLFKLLNRIPDGVFCKPSNAGLRLLLLKVEFVGSKAVEETLMDWFFDDSIGSSKAITNFNFNLHNLSSDFEVSQSVGRYVDCLRFLREGEEQIRVIIDGVIAESYYFMSSESPIYKILRGLGPGEKAFHNMQSLEVLERLPPYIGVFRLATSIRNDNNDGTDIFGVFTMPSDPDEIVAYITEKVKLGGGRESNLELIIEKDIPVFIKGHLLDSSAPFKAACAYFSNEDTLKPLLLNFGEEAPFEVVLDSYAMSYLAITGLAYGLDKMPVAIVLSHETRELADKWLSEITSPSYMALNVDDKGRLVRTTSEDILREVGHIVEGLRIILRLAEVRYPGATDMPIAFSNLSDGVDVTVLSAMKLSFSSSLPWLCMDPAFAQSHMNLGSKVVNSQVFVNDLIKLVSFDQRIHGIKLFGYCNVSLPLTYADIHFLLFLNRPEHDHLVYKIIKNRGSEIYSGENLVQLARLVDVLLLRLSSEGVSALKYINGAMQYVSHIFNFSLAHALNCLPEKSKEEKLLGFLNLVCSNGGRSDRYFWIMGRLVSDFVVGNFLNTKYIENNVG